MKRDLPATFQTLRARADRAFHGHMTISSEEHDALMLALDLARFLHEVEALDHEATPGPRPHIVLRGICVSCGHDCGHIWSGVAVGMWCPNRPGFELAPAEDPPTADDQPGVIPVVMFTDAR